MHGGEPESQAENDLGPHGEGDSIVYEIGEGRQEEPGDTDDGVHVSR